MTWFFSVEIQNSNSYIIDILRLNKFCNQRNFDQIMNQVSGIFFVPTKNPTNTATKLGSLMIYRLILTTHQSVKVFFALKSWNHIHCMFIFTFLIVVSSDHFCARSYRIEINKSDETVNGTTTPAQSGPGSNSSDGVPDTPQNSRTRASPSDAV